MEKLSPCQYHRRELCDRRMAFYQFRISLHLELAHNLRDGLREIRAEKDKTVLTTFRSVQAVSCSCLQTGFSFVSFLFLFTFSFCTILRL